MFYVSDLLHCYGCCLRGGELWVRRQAVGERVNWARGQAVGERANWVMGQAVSERTSCG